MIACQVCGVATDRRPETRHTYTLGGLPDRSRAYDVGTCDACAALDLAAPGSAVRAALRVVKRPVDGWERYADALLAAGVDANEVVYDRPNPRGDRGRQGPQRKPYGHVPRPTRAALRRVYADLLRAQVAAPAPEPTPEPPPLPGLPACLLCGISTALQWHGPLSVPLRDSTLVSGHLCDACEPAFREVGAWGPTVAEVACMAAKGMAWSEDIVVPSLRSWADTGLPPQATGWQWVGAIRLPEPERTGEERLRDEVRDLRAEVARLSALAGQP